MSQTKMNLELILSLVSQFLKNADSSNGGASPLDFISKLTDNLGLPLETIQNVLTLLTRLKSGELTFSQLIPTLLPIVVEFLSQNKNQTATNNFATVSQNCLKLNPIENLSDSDIYASLSDYFESDSAS